MQSYPRFLTFNQKFFMVFGFTVEQLLYLVWLSFPSKHKFFEGIWISQSGYSSDKEFNDEEQNYMRFDEVDRKDKSLLSY